MPAVLNLHSIQYILPSAYSFIWKGFPSPSIPPASFGKPRREAAGPDGRDGNRADGCSRFPSQQVMPEERAGLDTA
nr:hypothetical protein [Bacillaceae bacterium]